ncbi:Hypothetical predicted protein [Mytilus galloprovincialis]|uniref:Uncharacterized protein n=1 Tax=Mytilus galloprovincialis TaxID=29158 RepID=A0A8B6FTX7_MYTGA|nr:Hypothetical predicted protein [Mytilus galloprovincialis]
MWKVNLYKLSKIRTFSSLYDATKERLERKHGGQRRQITLYIKELENFKPMREGIYKDMKIFADLLDIPVVNLQEAGRFDELKNGSLYNKLQRKMTESMLSMYHRWIFESGKTESVECLREWILQESEFQTIASETIHGLRHDHVGRQCPRSIACNLGGRKEVHNILLDRDKQSFSEPKVPVRTESNTKQNYATEKKEDTAAATEGGQDQKLFYRTYFARGQEDQNDLDNIVSKFWVIENVKTPGEKVFLSSDDQKVEQSLEFEDRHYEVIVPCKDDTSSLPNIYNMAFKKYIEKGYARKVSTKEETIVVKWYLPHFPVIRPGKETTKTRIVFDASAKFQRISLNDTTCIHQGPKLQQDLFYVLLRFRKYPVVLVCDIAEMYLRIKIAPDDRPFHRFVWRALKTEQVPEEYEFNSVFLE